MKRFLSVITVLCLTLHTFAQQTIVVSPRRNGLEQALNKARKIDGAVTLNLHEGIYELDRPIVLTSEDNGLTIRSFPGEKVVLSGSRRLTLKWRPYKDGIFMAAVPPKMFDGEIDMLIVDGHISNMARFPNYDSTAVRFNGTSADATSVARVSRWSNPEGGYLHAMHRSDWGDFHYRITGRNPDGTLELEGGHQNNRRSGIHPDNRMVEGIFEELDAPD